MKSIIFLAIILVSLNVKGLNGIKLEDIDVPSFVWIDDDETDPIKLDCNYIVEGNPNDFLLQWKKDDELIYQWMYGLKPMITNPEESDLEVYETSKEPFQQYRGIIIKNPTIATTGEYKCIVRSYEGADISEKSMAKKLQVVHTRDHTLHLYHHSVENETRVECTVKDVYPQPKLSLISDDGDPFQIISSQVYRDENGFFNATTLAVAIDDDADPDTYLCSVLFPDVPINLTTSAESGSDILRPIVWLVTFAVLLRLR